jgi:hypothetical protein
MCLLGIAFQTDNTAPILVLANREESFSRPATPSRIQPPRGETPAWLGGTDLLAGGTWLAVNRHGLLVAITNRPRRNLPPALRSRGLLCRALLAFRTVESAVGAALGHLWQEAYAGCNLLVASRLAASVIEFGDELRVTSLSPGLHLITNGDLNDPHDRRIARVRQELATAIPGSPADWLTRARQVCALGPAGERPAICLAGTDRGTVSSTVLALTERIEDSQFWSAARSPAQVAYDDLSPLLRALLTAPGTAANGHRIQLRGPWRFEPLARARPDGTGGIVWSAESLPAPGTDRFPTSWQELLGEFLGRAQFRRRFHRPDNLDSHERVFVVFEEVSGTGAVTVNGQPLGLIDPATHAFEADVTDLLAGNDELQIELERTDDAEGHAPLWATAALEIRTTRPAASRGAG